MREIGKGPVALGEVGLPKAVLGPARDSPVQTALPRSRLVTPRPVKAAAQAGTVRVFFFKAW